MTIVQLPDEELKLSPGTFVKAFYSTSPISAADFANEVKGLDAIVIRFPLLRVNSLEKLRQLEHDEPVSIGDVIVINPNHALNLRQQYVIAETVDNGYKIRQLPSILILD